MAGCRPEDRHEEDTFVQVELASGDLPPIVVGRTRDEREGVVTTPDDIPVGIVEHGVDGQVFRVLGKMVGDHRVDLG